MEHLSDDLARALVTECDRRLAEGLSRLRTCLTLLDEAQTWRRPNAHTASAGNLVLHLCGNVRQWILSTLGGAPDRRERRKEFEEPGPIPRAELEDLLDLTVREALAVVRGLDPRRLVARYRVQGFEETGVGILVHVVEHFSYHVGQVTYIVKTAAGMDPMYYAGVDLNVRS